MGYCELYGLIVDGLEGDLNVSNVFERLRDSEIFNFASERLIAFAASHFHQFSSSHLRDISLSTFNQILSPSSLQIQDEDSLYDLLSQYFDTSAIYFSFVEYVRFEFLSNDRISHFTSFSSVHFELVTPRSFQ
jgi:hypothetical protein